MDRMEDKLDQLSVLLELRLCVKKKKNPTIERLQITKKGNLGPCQSFNIVGKKEEKHR